MGRPTKYDPTHNIFVTKLCRLGATNEDLAVALEVDRSQVVRWSARNKDFRTAVKLGREESDAEVGERLFQRACGYEHDETRVYTDKQGVPHEVTTTKIYPPSEVACIFWLKNRRPDLWRDVNRQEHTGKDGGPIQHATTEPVPQPATYEEWLQATTVHDRLTEVFGETGGGNGHSK